LGIRQAAAGEPTPTRKLILKTYSVEQIQQVSDYLLVRIEAEAGSHIISCDPSVETANAWSSGQVHSLLDEKIKTLEKSYNRDPSAFSAKVKDCRANCTCAPYELLFANKKNIHIIDDSPAAKVAHDTNLRALESQVESKDQSLICARKLNWFCSSPLMRYLKASL
jgi:hypothetical protein